MILLRAIGYAVFVWAVLGVVLFCGQEEAKCSACIGQYCAFDADCPAECSCAKPPWEVEGECW